MEHFPEMQYVAFHWDRVDACVVLGLGTLVNHSLTPNVRYIRHTEALCMSFVALRALECGEEVLTNYNGDPADQTPWDFEPVVVSLGGSP